MFGMKRVNLVSVFFLALLVTLFCKTGIYAQSPEFKVVSFKHDGNSLLARLNQRLDDNDGPCALIQVRSAEEGVRFTASSGIVGDVEWKNGDYWVYLSGGNRSLKIFKQGIKTVEYIFSPIPKSLESYILEIDVIRSEPQITGWPVTIITKPENATVTIDGNPVDRSSKTAQINEGVHIITLELSGYDKLEKTININKNNTYFEFNLIKVEDAALMINSEPDGATVYLEDVKLGETPLSVFYVPGNYTVKVVKEGYVTIENQTLTVTAPETKKIFTLEDNVGYLSVSTYKNAKVFVNDKEYTTHSNIKLTAQVLMNIKVTMPKAQDFEKQIVLKRNESITIDMFPEIETGTVKVAVTPFDATIELTGDAGEHYTYDGMHIFSDIPTGEYTLEVKAEGYATKNVILTLAENEVLDKNIKLERGPGGDIDMVFVMGGIFTMGCTGEQSDCDDVEKPAHKVTVSNFYIGKYEVTQKQWREIMGNNPSKFKNCDNCPVERVSWNKVQKFILKLNQKTGKTYRLPTEAEWEYTARGGASTGSARATQYAGSNNIDDVAWYLENSGGKTHPVGQKQPNELSIYDMSGNVREWCSDWYYSDYYDNSPRNNPKGPPSSSRRVNRGGSWKNSVKRCRVGYRFNYAPIDRYSSVGFRLVLVP
jgi:formylglycine-generating enzyme required for sulfatase activity